MGKAKKDKQSIADLIFKSVIWRSIFRSEIPKDKRGRMVTVLNNFFLHLHPVSIPRHAVKLKYTWMMGILATFLFFVLLISGILLMFYYRPTVQYAYNDVVDMAESTPLGVMREIHRWSAHLMVITVWFHMFRVFMTGSYKTPREFNWGVGVMLLTLTMLLSFTGYLLPWDQLAIWAITVGSNMAAATPLLGSEGPGSGLLSIGDISLIGRTSDAKFMLLGDTRIAEGALLRFYVFHCVFFPFIIFVFMLIHFWRVRKDGGISGPETS
jgi:quinol-cytochrome oxidoreductase complex cytochrome b subunit